MYARTILATLIFSFCPGLIQAAVTVGTCQSTKHPYTTISAAIAAAPAGGVVNICPGTYLEQIEIDKPLTIKGIVIANQPGVTIGPPTNGLNAVPTANSGFYPQIYVNNAGGPVNLSNLSVSGSGATVSLDGTREGVTSLCQADGIKDFPGVYFLNTPGILDHLNVSGQFGSGIAPGNSGPFLIPNCGNGIEIINSDPNAAVVVRDSVIGGVGYRGIYSSGNLTADHNVVNGGDFSHGTAIEVPDNLGTITDNTVSAAEVGIQGGQLIRGNLVQSAFYRIVGGSTVRHNTLINNSISISNAGEVSDNLISASTMYMQLSYLPPYCQLGNCKTMPTIGIDLGCADGTLVRNNGIVGVGIGMADVQSGEIFSPTNLFANVTTTSTSCNQ